MSDLLRLRPVAVTTAFLSVALLLGACSREEGGSDPPGPEAIAEQALPQYPLGVLPEGLQWETHNEDPPFASTEAVKGGTFRTFMLSFPLTLRTVGPDANGAFRSNLTGNRLALTGLHPDTRRIIPELATHWAYDPDGRTVYYRLDPRARWSDGRKVTADDYLFTLEFMRSPHIVAPWYNNQYTQEIKEVRKYDDYTIGVTGALALPRIDLHYYYGLFPTPRHFHKLDENWVRDYNWRIEPNTGPYQISRVDKGKYVEFELKEDWWARDLRYFRNRFNVKKVRISVIRDLESAFRYFLKGELESFPMVMPAFWHDKSQDEMFRRGYIHRIWFYNDVPQPGFGIFLNQEVPLFQDRNVRYAFAHAMNIDKMLQTVLRGDYMRLHNLYTGFGEYSNTELRARDFSLEKADTFLRAAGWVERGPDGIRIKDGKRLSVMVTYGAPDHTDRLILLKEEAKKAGLELQLELLDSAAAFKKMLEKKHEVAWMAWGTGFRPAYWEFYHSVNAHKPQTNNITNTDDADMDAMVMAYRDATDGARRAELSRQLQAKIHEMGMVIPTLMVPYTREAFWRWLKLPEHHGTRLSTSLFSPFGDSGGLFWVDEEDRSRTLVAKEAGATFDPVTLIDETWRVYR